MESIEFNERKIEYSLIRKNVKNIFYINGPETLPAPLSKTQEEEVFLMLETDEENARRILITHNLRLVVYIAKKFERKCWKWITKICLKNSTREESCC